MNFSQIYDIYLNEYAYGSEVGDFANLSYVNHGLKNVFQKAVLIDFSSLGSVEC
jgi:hypothetical protein